MYHIGSGHCIPDGSKSRLRKVKTLPPTRQYNDLDALKVFGTSVGPPKIRRQYGARNTASNQMPAHLNRALYSPASLYGIKAHIHV